MNDVLINSRSHNRLIEHTLEDEPKLPTSDRKASNGSSSKAKEKAVLYLGFDWGTNESCLKASFAGSGEMFVEEIIPSIVGYAKEGILEGLLPDNASTLY